MSNAEGNVATTLTVLHTQHLCGTAGNKHDVGALPVMPWQVQTSGGTFNHPAVSS